MRSIFDPVADERRFSADPGGTPMGNSADPISENSAVERLAELQLRDLRERHIGRVIGLLVGIALVAWFFIHYW
jgi:hypothetical protein